MKRFLGTPVIDYAPAVTLFVIAVIYLVTAYTYTPESRQFPVIVAWTAIALVALDFLARTRTAVGEFIKRWFNPSAAAPAEREERKPATRHIAAAIWTGAFVTLIVMIGFLYAVPAYVFASMLIRGRCSLWLSLAVSAAATLFIHLVFERLLELPLYPGVLFGGF